MKSKSKTRTTAKRETGKTTPDLHPQLLALCALIEESPEAMQRALDEARKQIANWSDGITLDDFVPDEIARGPYRKQVERAWNLDPGNMNVDLLCAYGYPSLRLGIGLAWLIMGGSR